MFKLSLIAPAFVALALVAVAPAQAAGPDASIHEVYQAAEAGRFDDAQKMMDKVLQDHPNSAKAHFVEAELLSKQARYGEAQNELNTALRLDPSQKFAKPGKVQELQGVINSAQQHRVVERSAPVMSQPAPMIVHQPERSSGTGWLVPMIILFAIIALFMMVRASMRRNVVVAGGYGPGGGYAPGYGGGPGYGPGYGGGGMGSGILGGLATGAAVGAGVVVGEELMENLTHHNRDTQYVRDDRNDNVDSGSQRQNDMGGNDFGVSDSSSWDSGSSGGDSSWDSGGGGGGGSDDW